MSQSRIKKYHRVRPLRLENLDRRELMAADVFGGSIAGDSLASVDGLETIPAFVATLNQGDSTLVSARQTTDVKFEDVAACTLDSGSTLDQISDTSASDTREEAGTVAEITGGNRTVSPTVTTALRVDDPDLSTAVIGQEASVRPTLLIVTHGLWATRDASWNEWDRYANKVSEELRNGGSPTITWEIDWDGTRTIDGPVAELKQRIRDFLDGVDQPWDILFFGHSRGAILNNRVLDDLAHYQLGTIAEISLDPTAATLLDDRYPIATDAAISSLYNDGYDLLTTVGGVEIDNAKYVDLHDEITDSPSLAVERNKQLADKLFEYFDSGWAKLFTRVGQVEADSILYHVAIEDFYLERSEYFSQDILKFINAKPELSTDQLKAFEDINDNLATQEILRIKLADGTTPKHLFENIVIAAINGMAHDRDNNLHVVEAFLQEYVDKLGIYDNVPIYKFVAGKFKEALQSVIDDLLPSLRSANVEEHAKVNRFFEGELLPFSRALDKAVAGAIDGPTFAFDVFKLMAKWDRVEWLPQAAQALKNELKMQLDEIAGVLWGARQNLKDVASALWSAQDNLSDVAHALYYGTGTSDIGAVANALWGNVTGDATKLAGALWNGIDKDLGRVAESLYKDAQIQDLSTVASALYNTMDQKNLGKLAHSLYFDTGIEHMGKVAEAMWGSVTNNAADLARALWSGVDKDLGRIATSLYKYAEIHKLSTVASALYKAMDNKNMGQVAEAMWGRATKDPEKLAGALWNGIDDDLGRIAKSLYKYVKIHDLSDVAHALYYGTGVKHMGKVAIGLRDGVTDDFREIAGALWHGVDKDLYRIATSLSKYVGGNVSQVADALYHGAQKNLGNVGKALWDRVTDDPVQIAKVLRNDLKAGFGDVANVLRHDLGQSLGKSAKILYRDLHGSAKSVAGSLGISNVKLYRIL